MSVSPSRWAQFFSERTLFFCRLKKICCERRASLDRCRIFYLESDDDAAPEVAADTPTSFECSFIPLRTSTLELWRPRTRSTSPLHVHNTLPPPPPSLRTRDRPRLLGVRAHPRACVTTPPMACARYVTKCVGAARGALPQPALHDPWRLRWIKTSTNRGGKTSLRRTACRCGA